MLLLTARPLLAILAVVTISTLLPSPALPQALFAEANFSDQQYSALVENLSLEETDLRSPFSGFQLYRAKVRIKDVYFGELEPGAELDIQINVAYFGKGNYLKAMSKPYILSFCRSDTGAYFTNRDFLIITGNDINIAEFERLRAEGTDFDGENDCTSTNFELLPVEVNES